MTGQETWVPADVDEVRPSGARVYDYLLGGAHNFESDRTLGEKFLTALPSARDVARLNRAFLRRAVLFLAESGIRQFLDIGSGIPTAGNVHEIVADVAPDARVVYVDNDAVAVSHSQLMLEGNPNAEMVQADMTEPDRVLNHPSTRKLLNFDEPLGLLMVGVFHFVPKEADAAKVVRRYRDALARGSALALSHFTADISPNEMAGVVEVMGQSSTPIYPRSYDEIQELFEGFDLLDPGVVGTALWRPDDPESAARESGGSQIYAGVGIKV